MGKTNSDCPSSVVVIPCTRVVAVETRPVVAPDSTVVIYFTSLQHTLLTFFIKRPAHVRDREMEFL